MCSASEDAYNGKYLFGLGGKIFRLVADKSFSGGFSWCICSDLSGKNGDWNGGGGGGLLLLSPMPIRFNVAGVLLSPTMPLIVVVGRCARISVLCRFAVNGGRGGREY